MTTMHRTRIKICGVRTPEVALAAARAGADWVGLVFVDRSPRQVTVAEARAVVRALPATVDPVGLFVDAPAERVREVAAAVGLRTVQLHGDETPEQVASLEGLRVLKAVAFNGGANLEWWRGVANVVGLLVDTPPVDAGALPGGSGRAFDWAALARWRAQAGDDLPPMFLAGGLTPANVAEAIATVRPYGVDVSSGVESARGVKDAALIEAFCAAVREADRMGDRAAQPR